MSWIIIGLSVGAVLGLTGAGGAVLAIPLFISLLEMSVKEATTASLMVVAIAAILGALTQQGKINLLVVSVLFLASTVGAWAAYPLKVILPTIVIKVLLAILALLSLYVMWRPLRVKSETGKPLWWHIPGGLILGGLTTLTGLGGGVVLLPWLRLTLGKTDIVTSLATIAMISSFSFGMQLAFGAPLPQLLHIGLTIAAIALASFIIKLIVIKLNKSQTNRLRLVVFSGVVLFTIITLFSRSA